MSWEWKYILIVVVVAVTLRTVNYALKSELDRALGRPGPLEQHWLAAPLGFAILGMPLVILYWLVQQ